MNNILKHILKIVVLTSTYMCVSHASPGQLEINHICATQLGCFSGDTPGYPVTIDGSAGRSYIFSGDLSIPDLNVAGIKINVADISIDLNGFKIIRAGCQDGSCATNSDGHGIDSPSVSKGLSIKNGSIIGMGGIGLLLGSNAVVEDMYVTLNGDSGLQLGDGARVINCSVTHNTLSGITVGNGSYVAHNTVNNNIDTGIIVGLGSTVINNAVFLQGQNGIVANEGALIQGNTIRNNFNNGLVIARDGAYRNNVFSVNINSNITGAGFNAGGNSCAGSLCP